MNFVTNSLEDLVEQLNQEVENNFTTHYTTTMYSKLTKNRACYEVIKCRTAELIFGCATKICIVSCLGPTTIQDNS